MPSALSAGSVPIVVRLWLARMYDVEPATLALYQSWLSAAEGQRYASFLHERRRREFIVGRGLARRALASELNCTPSEIQFEVAEQGQLRLQAPPTGARVYFNITHTADYVGCVVCRDHAVGVDVEKLNPRVSVLEIATRFFSTAESKALERIGEATRLGQFFTLWTIKESLAKAHGLGLAAPLESSSIQVDTGGIEAVTSYPPFSAGAWLAISSPTPQHRLAICVLCDESRVVSILPQAPEKSGDVATREFAWKRGWLRSE